MRAGLERSYYSWNAGVGWWRTNNVGRARGGHTALEMTEQRERQDAGPNGGVGTREELYGTGCGV